MDSFMKFCDSLGLKASHAVYGALGIALLLLCLIPVGMYISYSNQEVSLRNTYNAQQKVNEATFDKVWKTIKQSANVAETERESFKTTFVDIMNAQQGVAGNGSLASFFTQAKVDVSPGLFQKLMTTIDANRSVWLDSQTKTAQIEKDHEDLLQKIPSSLFVGGRPKLEFKPITSSVTEKVFSTGHEEDIELFK